MARRVALDLILNDVDQAASAGAGLDWPGGDGVFCGEGTFGGGSIAMQMQTRNGTWIAVNTAGTVTPISLTANGGQVFRAPAGKVRALVTTATAVFASVVGLPANIGG